MHSSEEIQTKVRDALVQLHAEYRPKVEKFDLEIRSLERYEQKFCYSLRFYCVI